MAYEGAITIPYAAWADVDIMLRQRYRLSASKESGRPPHRLAVVATSLFGRTNDVRNLGGVTRGDKRAIGVVLSAR